MFIYSFPLSFIECLLYPKCWGMKENSDNYHLSSAYHLQYALNRMFYLVLARIQRYKNYSFFHKETEEQQEVICPKSSDSKWKGLDRDLNRGIFLKLVKNTWSMNVFFSLPPSMKFIKRFSIIVWISRERNEVSVNQNMGWSCQCWKLDEKKVPEKTTRGWFHSFEFQKFPWLTISRNQLYFKM